MPSKGATHQRGYDHQHRKLREQVRPFVDAGKAVCWRCNDPIEPGEPWDLGHDDNDRSRYMGPEHPACNRSTAGRRVVFNGPPVDTSRAW